MHRGIPVVQNSDAWFLLREDHHKKADDEPLLRASEIGALIGVCPYVSQSLAKKIFIARRNGQKNDWKKQDEKYAFHMHRGHRMEPVILDHFKQVFPEGMYFKVGAFVHQRDALRFLASPDAIIVNKNELILLEIKNPVDVSAHQEKYNGVSPGYVAQVLVQMFVTGIKKAILCMCSEGEPNQVKEMVTFTIVWSDEVWDELCRWTLEAIEEAILNQFQNSPSGRKKERAEVLRKIVIKTVSH